jgi:hypothetical protein
MKYNNRKLRKPIKTFLRKDDIHKKFQQQCLSRIRKDREKKIWERRNLNNSNIRDEEMEEDDRTEYQRILKEEWDKFKLTYEYYGDLSVEELEEIEQEMKKESEIIDNEYLELLNYEQQIFENEIETYQEEEIVICPICEKGNLIENKQLEFIKCTNCTLELSNKQYNLKNLKERINELQINHGKICNNNLTFTYQPEIGLYGVCMFCCGMEIV